MAVRASYSAAWVLTMYDTDGTTVLLRAASTDLYSAAAVASLGAPYDGIITNPESVRVVQEYADGYWGIQLPSTATLTLSNVDTVLDPTDDLRGMGVVLRRYDWVADEVTTELSGIVREVSFVPGFVSVTIASHDDSALDTLIPRALVTVDEFPSAVNVGAPIPVVFGADAQVSCPHVGLDDTGDPGGADFLVGFLESYQSGAASTDAIIPLDAYYDSEPSSPGLESARYNYVTAPGSPTYVSATTFDVTGDWSAFYWTYTSGSIVGGATIRFKTTASPSRYVYGNIIGWAANVGTSGTYRVTVKAAANMDAGLTSVELGQEYFVERNRYHYDTDWELVSLRFPAADQQAVIAKVTNAESYAANPVRVIQQILTHPAWGLGMAVDGTAFDTAANAVTVEVAGTLGGDRTQQSARTVINDLCRLVGGRVTATTHASDLMVWSITLDAAAASAMTLGCGLTARANNLRRVHRTGRVGLDRAVKQLRVRYGPRYRAALQDETSLKAIVPTNARFEVSYPAILTGRKGTEQVVVSPWLTTAANAGPVAYYLGKRMDAGASVVECVADNEARSLALLNTVTVDIPDCGINAALYSVYRIERALHETGLTLRGYDATAYSYDANQVTIGDNTALDWSDEDGDTPQPVRPGDGMNLCPNPDFTASVTSGTLTGTMLPGYYLSDGIGLGGTITSAFTAVSVVRNDATALRTVGGAYLSVTTAGSGTPSIWVRPLHSPFNIDARAIPVDAGDVVYVSAYCDRSDWQIEYRWVGPDGYITGTQATSTPAMRVRGSETNGNGWYRFWCAARAPAAWESGGSEAPAYVIPYFTGFTNATTYKFDAVQIERALNEARGPTRWKRHSPWGVDPAFIQPGALTIRADSEAEHGTLFGHATATVNLGTSTVLAIAYDLIPARCIVQGVTYRVQTGDNGTAAGIDIGYDTDTDAWGATVSLTAGTTTTIADFTVVSPINFPSANPSDVRLTASGGDFNGGVVKVTVHYVQLVPPSS